MLIKEKSDRIDVLSMKTSEAVPDTCLATPVWHDRKSRESRMVFAYPKYSAMGREEERKKEFLAIGPLFGVKPDECPCCHGRHIVRYGHASSNGRGRYLCKDCHKTFCG